MANTVIQSQMYKGQDDADTRDIWVEVAPTGNFQEEVWQRMVWMCKSSGKIVEGDWRFSPNGSTCFDDAPNDPPAEVLTEYERIKPQAVYQAQTNHIGNVPEEGVARLYKTALFSDAAHAIEPKLPIGPVRVKFMSVEYNAFFNQEQPVFATYRTMDDSSFIGYYFSGALKEFCL